MLFSSNLLEFKAVSDRLHQRIRIHRNRYNTDLKEFEILDDVRIISSIRSLFLQELVVLDLITDRKGSQYTVLDCTDYSVHILSDSRFDVETVVINRCLCHDSDWLIHIVLQKHDRIGHIEVKSVFECLGVYNIVPSVLVFGGRIPLNLNS